MDNTRETPRQLCKVMHAAFTDFHVVVHDMLSDDDKVVAHWGVMDIARAMAQLGATSHD
jgi:hypothetical protein